MFTYVSRWSPAADPCPVLLALSIFARALYRLVFFLSFYHFVLFFLFLFFLLFVFFVFLVLFISYF